jgi:hypothetical protein
VRTNRLHTHRIERLTRGHEETIAARTAKAHVRARLGTAQAEGQVEILMHRTQAQLEDVQREIDGMRLKRRESEVMLESIIAAPQNTLEFVRELDIREGRSGSSSDLTA